MVNLDVYSGRSKIGQPFFSITRYWTVSVGIFQKKTPQCGLYWQQIIKDMCLGIFGVFITLHTYVPSGMACQKDLFFFKQK